MSILFRQVLSLRPIQEERRKRLTELAENHQPRGIYVGDMGTQALLGNIIISRWADESCSESEIEAMFLHEIGHLKDRLTAKLILSLILVIGGITVLLNTMFIFPTWREQLIPPVIGLAVYLPILRRYYPRYEYRADKHATDKGYGDELILLLQKEGEETGVLVGSIRGFVYPSAEERIKKIRENIGD